MLSGVGMTIECWPDGADTLVGRYWTDMSGDVRGRFTRVVTDLLRSAATLPQPIWGNVIRIPHVVGTLAGS